MCTINDPSQHSEAPRNENVVELCKCLFFSRFDILNPNGERRRRRRLDGQIALHIIQVMRGDSLFNIEPSGERSIKREHQCTTMQPEIEWNIMKIRF